MTILVGKQIGLNLLEWVTYRGWIAWKIHKVSKVFNNKLKNEKEGSRKWNDLMLQKNVEE